MASLNGTTGDDRLAGTGGSDRINGGSGADLLRGLDGDDSLLGSSGMDTLYGGQGADTLNHDILTGPDILNGDEGVDVLEINYSTSKWILAVHLSFPDTQVLVDGTVIDSFERLNVIGGLRSDRLAGGGFRDTLTGGGGDDSIDGRAGDDLLSGGLGNDVVIGGSGTDTAVFAGKFVDYQIENLSMGAVRVTGADGVDTLVGVERLQFTDQVVTLAGAQAPDWSLAAAVADGFATLNGRTVVPDLADSVAGKGFTCTGLARAADGTWWVANEGRSDASDATPRSSMVHLSADMTTVLEEVAIPTKTSLQGVAIRPDSNTLLVSEMGGKRILFYENGAAKGQLALSYTPNGLAYDSTLDALIIGRGNSASDSTLVEWRSFDGGTLIKTLSLSVNPDHLFFDRSEGEEGVLYFTYDGKQGVVGKVDVASGEELGLWRLPEADAIEGLHVEDGKLWVTNDAFFHNGAQPLNQILGYDTTPIAQVVDRGGLNGSLSVNLELHEQTLPDGTRLVGAERLIATGGNDADLLIGGRYDDAFQGNSGVDRLFGGGGSDRIVGGAGDDSIDGGLGADWLSGGEGSDIFVLRKGEIGGDIIADFSREGPAGGDLFQLEGFGAATLVRVGDTDQFQITPDAAHGGPSAAETIRIIGVSEITSADLMTVRVGGNVTDRMIGGALREAFYGGNGSDDLSGGGGNDALFGGDGFDNIDGGAGADILTGGTTNDRFIFRQGEANGDLVTDFTGAGVSGGDQLKFMGYGAASIQNITGTDFYRIIPQGAHGGDGSFEVIQLFGVYNLNSGDCQFII